MSKFQIPLDILNPKPKPRTKKKLDSRVERVGMKEYNIIGKCEGSKYHTLSKSNPKSTHTLSFFSFGTTQLGQSQIGHNYFNGGEGNLWMLHKLIKNLMKVL